MVFVESPRLSEPDRSDDAVAAPIIVAKIEDFIIFLLFFSELKDNLKKIYWSLSYYKDGHKILIVISTQTRKFKFKMINFAINLERNFSGFA